MNMLKEKKVWIGLLISVICLYLFIRKINPHELLASFLQANYWYLIPSVLLLLLSFYFRALRWRYFLIDFGDIPASRLMSPLMIGFMGNSLLPARLGEFIRAYILTRKEKINFSASFATIVVERIFDTLTILLFLVILLLVFPLPPHLPTEGLVTKQTLLKLGYISALICFAGVIFLFVFRWKTLFCMKYIEVLLKPLPAKLSQKLSQFAHQFADGLAVFHDIKGMILATFYSILVWASISLGNYYVLKAFGLHTLPITAAVFVLVLVAFGVALPSAPGYIGIYHKVCQFALEIYGVDASMAASVAIILHASQIIPVVIVGLIYLWKENMSFKQLREIHE